MIDLVRNYIIPAAYSLLPPVMASPAATRMLLAIGWQESRLVHRQQIVGPARGLWQFELGGSVTGVLTHPATEMIAGRVLDALCYTNPVPAVVHSALAHNDILAAAFARLLLWTLPQALPLTEADGWAQYRAAWRPGKPHPQTWPHAWAIGA